jgi:dimethylargininase
LHLKSGIAYLGDAAWVADGSIEAELRRHTGVRVGDVITAPPSEAYAANCVRINDIVLLAAGYPAMSDALKSHGYRTVSLDMSEFRKMDGGLSCLSLRYDTLPARPKIGATP